MFNTSASICDGADSAADDDSAAADDSDNCMYESSDSETDCDWQIFRENDKLPAIGSNVWHRINSHERTYIQHEVCSARLCIKNRRLFSYFVFELILFYFEIYRIKRRRVILLYLDLHF